MKLCTDYKSMFENIIKNGLDYLKKYPNVKTMVVGLSGGIDSALTAAIARKICDRHAQYKLIGVSIPIVTNKKSEIQLAQYIGEDFCHKFKEIKSINTIFKIFGRFIKAKTLPEKIRLGNLKARLRMLTLYDIAHRNDGIVLSTDNLSEFNLGFWTLHGDVGDLGLIQGLWKTEVYGLARYLSDEYHKIFTYGKYTRWVHYDLRSKSLDWSIEAVPTGGLGVSDSDFDQLGVKSYEEADKILIEYINTRDKKLESHPIIERHLKYIFKHENPYNIPRGNIITSPKAGFNITKGMPFETKTF